MAFWTDLLKTDLLKWAIPSLSAAFVVPALNYTFQWAELQRNEQLRTFELKIKKQDMEGKYLAQFITHALNKDYETRIAFAHYFATLTVDAQVKANWQNYLNDVTKKRNENLLDIEREKKAIIEAKVERDKKIRRIAELTEQITRLTKRAATGESQKVKKLEQERKLELAKNISLFEKAEKAGKRIARLERQTFAVTPAAPIQMAIGSATVMNAPSTVSGAVLSSLTSASAVPLLLKGKAQGDDVIEVNYEVTTCPGIIRDPITCYDYIYEFINLSGKIQKFEVPALAIKGSIEEKQSESASLLSKNLPEWKTIDILYGVDKKVKVSLPMPIGGFITKR